MILILRHAFQLCSHLRPKMTKNLESNQLSPDRKRKNYESNRIGLHRISKFFESNRIRPIRFEIRPNRFDSIRFENQVYYIAQLRDTVFSLIERHTALFFNLSLGGRSIGECRSNEG